MIEKIPKWLVVGSALAGAATGTFSAGVLFAAWPGIPAQVEENQDRLVAVEQKLDRVICLLRLPPNGDPLDCERGVNNE